MDLLYMRRIAMAPVRLNPGVQPFGDGRRIRNGDKFLLRLVRNRRSGEDSSQAKDGEADGDRADVDEQATWTGECNHLGRDEGTDERPQAIREQQTATCGDEVILFHEVVGVRDAQ